MKLGWESGDARFSGFLKKKLCMAVLLLLLLGFVGPLAAQDSGSQVGYGILRHVRTFETAQLELLEAAGLAYLPGRDIFVVLEPNKNARPGSAWSLVLINGFEDFEGTLALPPSISGNLSLTFDGAAHRLLLFSHAVHELIEIPLDPSGLPDISSISRINVSHFNLQNPQGMTVDPGTGNLYFLDSASQGLLRVELDPFAREKGAAAHGSGRVSWVDLAKIGAAGFHGLAFNSVSGTLFFGSPAEQLLYEITPEGLVVSTRALTLGDTPGMVFAPSGDLTDGPGQKSIFIADLQMVRGGYQGGKKRVGGLIEYSITPFETIPATLRPGSGAAASLSDDRAVLVRTIDMSLLSSPSPDPADLTYLPSFGTLLVADSEVDEMSIFKGGNLFELTLNGALVRTGHTTRFSNEPTGLAFNPASGHLFITDDSADRVFEVGPGTDGLFGTADDLISSFGTRTFNSTDPEGIAFSRWTGSLFVSDGLNAEIYRIDPGSNGIFDGLPPIGDDLVSSFDTALLGISDPEGIEFNAENGHLYLVGAGTRNTMVAATVGGTFLKSIDISAARAVNPAGLAFAPASNSSSGTNIYISDRGLDNSADPNENDGKVYEMSLPVISAGNLPPSVSAGADQSIDLAENAQLSGVVSDDGLPNPPGQLTVLWSQVRGPGSVIFSNSSDLNATARFSEPGTYALRLTVDDGEFSRNDELTVVVSGNDGGSIAINIRIDAGGDDAEESAGGAVSLLSSDLELVFDGSNQVVGLRFNRVSVPFGANILDAYVQFQVDETSSEPTYLLIQGQASDNPVRFTNAIANISSRPRTAAAVAWSPPAWSTVGASGHAQRTPSIAPIIQEISRRPGWVSGNSLVILFSGTGKRVAESFDGIASAAPLLHVVYSDSIGPVNLAPNVSAGSDQIVSLPNPATLNGTVSDDGLPIPPGGLTTTWSQVRGPGSVIFSDPGALDATVTFTEEGSYVLRLTANDGELLASDELTIVAAPVGGTVVTQVRVSASADDAEENAAGSVSLTSSDLELVWDKSDQVVGLRFNGLPVPFGSNIVEAYLQFQVDEASSDLANLLIQGQASDNPASFAAVTRNLSSRPRTAAAVAWSPPVWPTVGGAGLDQRTPNIAPVIQEIVNRPGWSSGNSLVILITGTGTRVAESYDGLADAAPLLRVVYASGGGPVNLAPSVSAGADQAITLPASAILDGTVSDDGLPDPPGVVTTTWSKVSGPGTVTFANAAAEDTMASFSSSGSYVLRLTAHDGERSASSDLTVVVAPAGGTVIAEFRVNASANDAEESAAGAVSLLSSDLELVFDGSDQMVGMRFNGVTIPPGSRISEAYVQFQVDETSSEPTSLLIQGQASDNPLQFTNASNNISSRPRTVAAVAWSPQVWPTVGAAGLDQRTPNIAPVLQEIVNRSGWSSGNALAILISGNGRRVAESYDGVASAAPLLRVVYTIGN